jgi:aryl-alcohol dehydrogenase-like predicted oxidoreductase
MGAVRVSDSTDAAARVTTALVGGTSVPRIGLGTFPLSDEGRPDDGAALRLVLAALEAGVRFLDTADSYHLSGEAPGHGEDLLRRALTEWNGDREEVVVATKGGRQYRQDRQRYCAGRPEQIRAACEASLERLGVESIDLYFFHRPDPDVPYEESVGALSDLQAAGLIRSAGISNANEAQIRAAVSVLGPHLAAVQNEFSPWFRSSESELFVTAELGLAFLPWSPLGGAGRHASLSAIPAYAEIAAARGCTPQQAVLAWMLAKSSNVVPIPGSTREATMMSSFAALDIQLEPGDVARLDAVEVPGA